MKKQIRLAASFPSTGPCSYLSIIIKASNYPLTIERRRAGFHSVVNHSHIMLGSNSCSSKILGYAFFEQKRRSMSSSSYKPKPGETKNTTKNTKDKNGVGASSIHPFFYSAVILVFFVGLIFILCIVLHSMDIFQSLLFKLAPSLAGRALCSLMGFYSAGLTLTILLAALLTWDANPYSMLPGSSHQPHVPEHQVPQEHFPEHAVAHRSEPGEIELKQPLLLDQERQTELESRLNRHFIIGIRRPNELYTVAYGDLIEKQIFIKKSIEMTLLNEYKYTGERILANRFEIRENIFYKEKTARRKNFRSLFKTNPK